MSELKFSPGKAVEVSLNAEDSLDIWYPATFVNETAKGSFEVEYKRTDEGRPLHVVVDCDHIRPSPPVCDNETFQLLEKVDAFCNFGWSSGVVTKVLAEGRYIVYFKRTKKEKELKHADLRLPMMQTHGKWAHSYQDAAVTSNTQETKDNSLGGNGKISVVPVNPGVVKESEEVRKGQKEKSRSVSCMGIEEDLKNMTPLTIRKKPRRNKSFKELNAESAEEELWSPLEVCGTKLTQTEQLPQEEPLEGPFSDVKSNPRTEQSENGKHTVAKSASPSRVLEASVEKLGIPMGYRTPFRGNRGRGRGRPVGSKNQASVTGGATPPAELGPVSIAECFQGTLGKPIVISLPCYKSDWKMGPGQGTSKRPVHSLTVVQEEEEQLPQEEEKHLPLEEETQLRQEEIKQLPLSVTDGSTVNDLDCDNHENVGLYNKDGTLKRKRGRPFDTPRRKRGRPFGSLSYEKRKLKEAEEVGTILSSSQRRSTRERREVYKTAIDTLRPRTKRPRAATEIPSPIQEEKDKAVIRYSLTDYVEPISHGVSGNMSDDDRPLSTWFGEAHSLPDHTKPNSGDNDSQSDKRVEITIGVSSDDLAEDEITTRESKGEKVTDLVAKGLPFSKISPVWEVIESMEIFKQIPQNPHFQPLYATREHCREGQAICSMVTFSRLVEDISKFQFDDPHNILEGSAETLSDLERQGFNVEPIMSRLNTLVSIKTKHAQAHSIEKQIAQEQKEKAGMDKEMAEVNRKMAELREKQELFVLKKVKIDSRIGELQSRFEPVREVLEAARSEFDRLASSSW